MDDAPRHTDQEDMDLRMRRLLSALPKVPAPGDFEARLEGRIRGRRSGFHRWMTPGLRFPAVAYSLGGLLVVGVVSYLFILRPGTTQQMEPVPSLKEKGMARPPAVAPAPPGKSEPLGMKRAAEEPAQNSMKPQDSPQGMIAPATRSLAKAPSRADSLALRDSLRVDSLRRAKKGK